MKKDLAHHVRSDASSDYHLKDLQSKAQAVGDDKSLTLVIKECTKRTPMTAIQKSIEDDGTVNVGSVCQALPKFEYSSPEIDTRSSYD